MVFIFPQLASDGNQLRSCQTSWDISLDLSIQGYLIWLFHFETLYTFLAGIQYLTQQVLYSGLNCFFLGHGTDFLVRVLSPLMCYCFILEQGYSEAQLKECLEEYAALNVWQIHPDSFNIRFIDA